MTLETILIKYFGCKKPVLKNPEKFTDWDGERKNRYLTYQGIKSYTELIGLLYDLKELVEKGIEFDVDDVIEDLDTIAFDNAYTHSEERLK